MRAGTRPLPPDKIAVAGGSAALASGHLVRSHGGNEMSNRKLAVKVKAYRILFAVASIAAIIEVLGAGRRF